MSTVTAGSLVVSTEAREAGGSTAAWLPHLDGLRAVAVYLVVLYHAGSKPFSGGFVGVDVFFVLSGFLVTRLLLRDIARSRSIQFGRFYSRRFRRLLPAAFVTLVVSALVFSAIGSPLDVVNAVGSFKAAFLYSANWYFIHQSQQYFGANIDTNPILHFWSLAVEEQFYLIWPLALGGAFALTRRLDHAAQLRLIRIAVAVAALASMVWALSLRATDMNRAYYGTDARAYELLGGALLALAPTLVDRARRSRVSMRVATTTSAAVLLILASSWLDVDAIVRGVGVTITTCVLLVAIEAADGGLIKSALSTRPIVYLGKISYGTYLWHWIVILVVAQTFRISTIAMIGIAALVATSLASLSFQILEQPVRASRYLDRFRRSVIVGGLVVSVVAAVVLIPKIVVPVDAATPVVRNSSTAEVDPHLTPRPRHLLSDAITGLASVACVHRAADACTIVKGSGPRILLMGDSQAMMLIPAFEEIARREGASLSASTSGGCPWQRDLFTAFRLRSCKEFKDDVFTRLLSSLRPNIVVVASLDYGTAGTFTGPLRDVNDRPVDFADVDRATKASLSELRAGGRRVVMVETLPIPVDHHTKFDPFGCLKNASVLEDCRFQAETSPTPLERLYRSLAARDRNLYSLDLDQAVCPLLPTCDPVVNGQIVRLDAAHLAVRFSQSIAPELDIRLKGVGMLPVG